MKKYIVSAIMCISLMVSVSTMAEDKPKKETAKAKIECKKDCNKCDKKESCTKVKDNNKDKKSTTTTTTNKKVCTKQETCCADKKAPAGKKNK